MKVQCTYRDALRGNRQCTTMCGTDTVSARLGTPRCRCHPLPLSPERKRKGKITLEGTVQSYKTNIDFHIPVSKRTQH